MTTVEQAAAPVVQTPTITLAGAQRVIAAALEKAEELKLRGAIVVVDAGGHVQALVRTDGAVAVATTVAQNKASTALVLRTPTDEFAEMIRQDTVLVSSLASQPGMALFSGGVPLTSGGTVIGSVGVSGGMGDEDLQVARAGAAAIA
ncbi:heme-binding protein [Streptomyces sp. NPDC021098]|uniref:GlcG/HbpS family heme-binding protein n=1 Tax=unclassified Streptomyces TaxID=2593676 RepID=UPI0037B57E13